MFRFPDEGIAQLLSCVPQGVTRLGTLYVALFTSQTPSTVPEKDAVIQNNFGVVEATGLGYKRMPIDRWGAAVEVDGEWLTTAITVHFPRVGSGGWGQINGYAITTGRVALCYANFDDGLPIKTGVGDLIEVTPTWRMV